MQFGILGVDYQRADLNIRDYISFTDQKKMDFFHLAEEKGMEQVMILSTCNRSEVYYCFESETQKEQMKALYNDVSRFEFRCLSSRNGRRRSVFVFISCNSRLRIYGSWGRSNSWSGKECHRFF